MPTLSAQFDAQLFAYGRNIRHRFSYIGESSWNYSRFLELGAIRRCDNAGRQLSGSTRRQPHHPDEFFEASDLDHATEFPRSIGGVSNPAGLM
jgi:hypothetical protein